MRPLGFVPAPLAQLPWRMILPMIAIGCFGLLVLYSAAGGRMRPWALPQGVRFVVFLGWRDRRSRASAGPGASAIGLPGLCRASLVCWSAGRGARLGRRRRPALARSRHHPPPAVRADEARRSSSPGPLLRPAAGRRDAALERDLAGRAADRRAGRAGPGPARSRHRADGRGRRRDRHVPRRPAAAPVRRRRARASVAGRRSRSVHAARLSAQAGR